MVKSINEIRLDEIGGLTGTDKSSAGHGYLDFYERFFSEIRYENIKLLEIGVFRGQSARMWELYFPLGSIIGLDIDPSTLEHTRGRVQIMLANQNDAAVLNQMATSNGPFDIIIDDGSHVWEHQITSFQTLFKYVIPGGYYVIEDLQVCIPGNLFYEQCRGNSEFSTTDYLEKLSKYVVGRVVPDHEDDYFLRSAATEIDFMAFGYGTVLIRRK